MRIITRRKVKVRVSVQREDGSVGSVGWEDHREYHSSDSTKQKPQSDEKMLSNKNEELEEKRKTESQRNKIPDISGIRLRQETNQQEFLNQELCEKYCCAHKHETDQWMKMHFEVEDSKMEKKPNNSSYDSVPDSENKCQEDINFDKLKNCFDSQIQFEKRRSSEEDFSDSEQSKESVSSNDGASNKLKVKSESCLRIEKGAIPKFSNRISSKSRFRSSTGAFEKPMDRSKRLSISVDNETLVPSILKFSDSPNHPAASKKISSLVIKREGNKRPRLCRTTLHRQDNPAGMKKVEVSMYPWGVSGLGSQASPSFIKVDTNSESDRACKRQIFRPIRRNFQNSKNGHTVNVSHHSSLKTSENLTDGGALLSKLRHSKIERFMRVRIRRNVDATDEDSSSNDEEERAKAVEKRKDSRKSPKTRHQQKLEETNTSESDIIDIIDENFFNYERCIHTADKYSLKLTRKDSSPHELCLLMKDTRKHDKKRKDEVKRTSQKSLVKNTASTHRDQSFREGKMSKVHVKTGQTFRGIHSDEVNQPRMVNILPEDTFLLKKTSFEEKPQLNSEKEIRLSHKETDSDEDTIKSNSFSDYEYFTRNSIDVTSLQSVECSCDLHNDNDSHLEDSERSFFSSNSTCEENNCNVITKEEEEDDLLNLTDVSSVQFSETSESRPNVETDKESTNDFTNEESVTFENEFYSDESEKVFCLPSPDERNTLLDSGYDCSAATKADTIRHYSTITEESEEEEVFSFENIAVMGQYHSVDSDGTNEKKMNSNDTYRDFRTSSHFSSGSWRISQTSTTTNVSSSSGPDSEETLAENMSELSSVNSHLSNIVAINKTLKSHDIKAGKFSFSENIEKLQDNPDINPLIVPVSHKKDSIIIKNAISDLESIEQAAQTLLQQHQISEHEIDKQVESQNVKENSLALVTNADTDNEALKYPVQNKDDTREIKTNKTLSEINTGEIEFDAALVPSVNMNTEMKIKKWSAKPFISRESYNEEEKGALKESESLRSNYNELDLNDFLDKLETSEIKSSVDEDTSEEIVADIEAEVELSKQSSPDNDNSLKSKTEKYNVLQTRSKSKCNGTKKLEHFKERILGLVSIKKNDNSNTIGDSTKTCQIIRDIPEGTPLHESKYNTPESQNKTIECHSQKTDIREKKISPLDSYKFEEKKSAKILNFLKRGSPVLSKGNHCKEFQNRKSDIITSESENEDHDSFHNEKSVPAVKSSVGSPSKIIACHGDFQEVKKEVRFYLSDENILGNENKVKTKKSSDSTNQQISECDCEKSIRKKGNKDLITNEVHIPTTGNEITAKKDKNDGANDRTENILPKFPEGIKPPRRKPKKLIPTTVENISLQDFEHFSHKLSLSTANSQNSLLKTKEFLEVEDGKTFTSNQEVQENVDDIKGGCLEEDSVSTKIKKIIGTNASDTNTVSINSFSAKDDLLQASRNIIKTGEEEFKFRSLEVSGAKPESAENYFPFIKESTPSFPEIDDNSTSFYDNVNPYYEPMLKLLEVEEKETEEEIETKDGSPEISSVKIKVSLSEEHFKKGELNKDEAHSENNEKSEIKTNESPTSASASSKESNDFATLQETCKCIVEENKIYNMDELNILTEEIVRITDDLEKDIDKNKSQAEFVSAGKNECYAKNDPPSITKKIQDSYKTTIKCDNVSKIDNELNDSDVETKAELEDANLFSKKAVIAKQRSSSPTSFLDNERPLCSLNKPPGIPPRNFQQKMPLSVVNELKFVLLGTEDFQLKKPVLPPRWDSVRSFRRGRYSSSSLYESCRMSHSPILGTKLLSNSYPTGSAADPHSKRLSPIFANHLTTKNNLDTSSCTKQTKPSRSERLDRRRSCSLSTEDLAPIPEEAFPHKKVAMKANDVFASKPTFKKEVAKALCQKLPIGHHENQNIFRVRANVYPSFQNVLKFPKNNPSLPDFLNRQTNIFQTTMEEGYQSDPGTQNNCRSNDITSETGYVTDSEIILHSKNDHDDDSCKYNYCDKSKNGQARRPNHSERTNFKCKIEILPPRPPLPSVRDLGMLSYYNPVIKRQVLGQNHLVRQKKTDNATASYDIYKHDSLIASRNNLLENFYALFNHDLKPPNKILRAHSDDSSLQNNFQNHEAHEAHLHGKQAKGTREKNQPPCKPKENVKKENYEHVAKSGSMPECEVLYSNCRSSLYTRTLLNNESDLPSMFLKNESNCNSFITAKEGIVPKESENTFSDSQSPSQLSQCSSSQRPQAQGLGEWLFLARLDHTNQLLSQLNSAMQLQSDRAPATSSEYDDNTNYVNENYDVSSKKSHPSPPRPRTPIDERDSEQLLAEQRYLSYFKGPPRAKHHPNDDLSISPTLQQIEAQKRFNNYFIGLPQAKYETAVDEPINLDNDEDVLKARRRYMSYFQTVPRPRTSSKTERQVSVDQYTKDAQPQYMSDFQSDRRSETSKERSIPTPDSEQILAEKRYLSYFQPHLPRPHSNIEISSITPDPDPDQLAAEKRYLKYFDGFPKANHKKMEETKPISVTPEMIEAEKRFLKYFQPIPFGAPRNIQKFPQPNEEEMKKRRLFDEFQNALASRTLRKQMKIVRVSRAKNEREVETTPPSLRDKVVEEFLKRVQDRKKEKDLHFGDTDSEDEEDITREIPRTIPDDGEPIIQGGGRVDRRISVDLKLFVNEEGE